MQCSLNTSGPDRRTVHVRAHDHGHTSSHHRRCSVSPWLIQQGPSCVVRPQRLATKLLRQHGGAAHADCGRARVPLRLREGRWLACPWRRHGGFLVGALLQRRPGHLTRRRPGVCWTRARRPVPTARNVVFLGIKGPKPGILNGTHISCRLSCLLHLNQ